ncbi:hypothetical protein TRVL_09126 [Trypanosoma vivax]|nr:hypothetical protein TRVL_09126 [Trypanosoma vivax]
MHSQNAPLGSGPDCRRTPQHLNKVVAGSLEVAVPWPVHVSWTAPWSQGSVFSQPQTEVSPFVMPIVASALPAPSQSRGVMEEGGARPNASFPAADLQCSLKALRENPLRFRMPPPPALPSFSGALGKHRDPRLWSFRRAMIRWHEHAKAALESDRCNARKHFPELCLGIDKEGDACDVSALKRWSEDCFAWWEEEAKRRTRRGYRQARSGAKRGSELPASGDAAASSRGRWAFERKENHAPSRRAKFRPPAEGRERKPPSTPKGSTENDAEDDLLAEREKEKMFGWILED